MPDLDDPSDPATLTPLGRIEPAQLHGYLASHGWHLLDASQHLQYWTEPPDGHVHGVELEVPTAAFDVHQWPTWWQRRAGNLVYSISLVEDRPMPAIYHDLTGAPA